MEEIEISIKNSSKKDKKSKKKKSKIGKAVLIIVLIIVIVGAVLVFNFAKKIEKHGGGVSGAVSALVDATPKIELDKIYCVLLGQSQNLTDTIMLASYDPKIQEANLLTIPRDTFIGDNKYNTSTYDKINALCQYDYPEKTVKAVADITGIDVENYVLIDTEALVDMVDLIGGVEFDVPIDMDYDDNKQNLHIHVDAGLQLLDGKTAEGVVRFRHNNNGTTYPEKYGVEDAGRSKTQRAFLVELANQTLKPENIFKIGGFIDLFYENVETNLTIDAVKEYLPYAVKFDTDNIKTEILPGESKMLGNYYFFLHDEEETKALINNLYGIGEIVLPTISKNINVEVLNGISDEDESKQLEKELIAAGYTVATSKRTTLTQNTMIINRKELTETEMNELSKIIDTEQIFSGEKQDNIDITIIIGSDYNQTKEK